ncbi:MAG: 4Fe-4S dicluster domain-containing protein [Chitinivibrionales bacterium]|nr:4Fe-4S dicluster domain-containing protein [Chitinivibrionales bacterium]MBD3358362.1 4Fe-4S dicluster domain-containing protein [Chitinivibrionales bacterium]
MNACWEKGDPAPTKRLDAEGLSKRVKIRLTQCYNYVNVYQTDFLRRCGTFRRGGEVGRKIINVGDIAAWRGCLGCGACAFVCRKGAVSLVDVLDEGIRPLVDRAKCDGCGECVRACPGYKTAHETETPSAATIRELGMSWGPILEVWEGHADDDCIRYYGSSGGVASMLALYCIEKGGMEAILHTGSDNARPWKSATLHSRERDEVLCRAGSRYAPASPCEGLGAPAAGKKPWVFVGKPCDIGGVRNVCKVRPELSVNIGCCISLFCAGTPSTRGTLGLLERFEVGPEQVQELRFRGRGWPGHAGIRRKGHADFTHNLSYEECWAYLQQFRPYRCHLCPDGTGELADIACGDPWCREPNPGELGRSLVLVRTERGREIVRGALRKGYVHLKRQPPHLLVDSQPNLYRKRCSVWGRCAAFRLCGLPTPQFRGFSLASNWRRLSMREQARSIFGTLRRIATRGYLRPLTYVPGAIESHMMPGIERTVGIKIANINNKDTVTRKAEWLKIGNSNTPR